MRILEHHKVFLANGNCLLVTKQKANIVNNQRHLETLHKISEMESHQHDVTSVDLSEEDSQFLRELNLISPESPSGERFSNWLFVTESGKEDLPSIGQSTHFETFMAMDIAGRNIVYLQSDFDFKKLEKMTIKCAKNSSNLITSFVFSHYLFISNAYISSVRSPCPKCLYKHIHGFEAGKRYMGEATFFDLADFISNNSLDLPPRIPLSQAENFAILWFLGSHLTKIKNESDALRGRLSSRWVRLDLLTAEATEDIALHSEYCTCLGEDFGS